MRVARATDIADGPGESGRNPQCPRAHPAGLSIAQESVFGPSAGSSRLSGPLWPMRLAREVLPVEANEAFKRARAIEQRRGKAHEQTVVVVN